MHVGSLALVLACFGPPADHELPSWDYQPPARPAPPPEIEEPFDGTGPLVIGSVLLSGGVGTTIVGSLMLSLPGFCEDCKDPPVAGLIAIGLGPAMVVSGSIALIVSHVLKVRHRRWQPNVAVGATTMQIGLIGRF